ncbi:hypothetical protein FQA39_LY05157 [Lamprigera yunnana]|nr:hypothetical protein FQA39_LY05157 [Lamprigera yunnana]
MYSRTTSVAFRSHQWFVNYCSKINKNLPKTSFTASFVPICRKNDPELSTCVIRAVNTIRPYLVEGIPEMDLPSGEPLRLFNATAKTIGVVTVSAKSWNLTGYGLMNFDIKSINFDFQNAKCSTKIFFPSIRLRGKYKFNGRVLLFQIDTIGDYDINATSVATDTVLLGKFYTINSKRFIEFEKVQLHLKIGHAKVYFDNLLNQNEKITATLNQAINENIESIIEEMGPVIEETLGEMVRMYFNKVFRLFSLDILFPED